QFQLRESFRQCPESFLDPQENSQLLSRMESAIKRSDNPQASADRNLNVTGNKMPLRKNWVLVLAAVIFLAVAAVYAFATSSSYFSSYDDEGFMMLSVRGYLDGQPLYDGLPTYYGPCYYFYEWFLHHAVS